jgi:hypothetical protein
MQGKEGLFISACVRDGSCRLVAGEIMEESRRLAREKKGEYIKPGLLERDKLIGVVVWDMTELERLEEKSSTRRGWCVDSPSSLMSNDTDC